MRKLLLLALLVACGGRSDAWDRPGTLLGPVVLKDRLAWVDGARDRLVFVEASANASITSVRLGRRAVAMQPTADRSHVLVITRGEEGAGPDGHDEPPGLYVVAEGGNAAVRYEIGSPFDRLAIAADGSRAVAYFSEAGPDEDGLFRNPNELAVVDLTQPPAPDNPTLRTVRSFGAAPIGVSISPPMVVPGAEDATPRSFAFVLAPGVVTILDATYPARKEVSVRLSLDGAATVVPRELVFAPGVGAAYLRADGARDVLEILLSGEAPESATDNDFQPALAELGAGAAPADVAVFDDVTGVRRVIAATPGSREVTIIDADTAQFVQVDVGDRVDRVLLLPAEQPRVALVASIGARAPRVHLVDLETLGDRLTPPQVRTLPLAAPVHDVVAVPQRELVLLVHDDDRTVLELLDVRAATLAPIQGAGRLDSYAFDAGGSHLVGATRGVARVGVVELGNLHPSDVRLDDLPENVYALPTGAVVVDHGGVHGHITVLPAASARREDAIVLTGFLLGGLFDEEL